MLIKWSLTLREESRLREIEKRLLIKIFGTERVENEKLRRLYRGELHSFYFSSNMALIVED